MSGVPRMMEIYAWKMNWTGLILLIRPKAMRMPRGIDPRRVRAKIFKVMMKPSPSIPSMVASVIGFLTSHKTAGDRAARSQINESVGVAVPYRTTFSKEMP